MRTKSELNVWGRVVSVFVARLSVGVTRTAGSAACGVVCLLLLAAASPAGAGTIYVNGATGNDAWDGLCEEWDGGTCGPKATIQAAINVAVDGDEVVVADGTYTGDGNKNLDFGGKPITVRSASGDATTCVIDCEGEGRGFYFHYEEGPDSVVDGLTVTGGNVDAESPGGNRGGGAYCYMSNPTLSHCTMTQNTAVGSYSLGGGVCLYYGDAALVGCTISHNTAVDGGGVYVLQGAPNLTQCTVTENEANEQGGGVFCLGGTPSLFDCMISDNRADDGGGVFCWDSAPELQSCEIAGNDEMGVSCREGSILTLTQCVVSGNASIQGGGIHCRDSHLLSTDSLIASNEAQCSGGGMYCYSSAVHLWGCNLLENVVTDSDARAGGACFEECSVVLLNCSVTGNYATLAAGGLRFTGGDSVVTSCILSYNGTGGWGGAMYCRESTALAVCECTIHDNWAYEGGGVYTASAGAIVDRSRIVGNTAGRYGGGLCCEASLVRGCLISQNSAGVYGGGVYCSSSTVQNCTVSQNVAHEYYGGGLYNPSSAATSVAECVFWHNVPDEIHGSVNVAYTAVENGSGEPWFGEGCIDADPLFVDPDGPDNDPETWGDNDFRLQAVSPCVEAGDPSFIAEPGALDLDGHVRVWDGDGDDLWVVDMGAYEFGSYPVGDCDCDGAVTFDDVQPFIRALDSDETYYSYYPDCRWLNADVDGDGAVTFDDIQPFVGLFE